MMPRIVLVTGSAPPDHCGVGDYTVLLATALEKIGGRVEVFCHRDWSVRGSLRAVSRLASARDSIVHIQYPTLGYGYSLGPQLCALAKSSVVTIHEFTLAHKLRKLSLIPLTWRARRVVMTSDSERTSLLQVIPWIASRIRMIPIGSNIPPIQSHPDGPTERIVHFGLIMPRKGLEDFIEFARLARSHNCSWELMIVGQIRQGHEGYARQLMEQSKPWQVKWELDRSSDDVARLFSNASLAYFPFPDGASDRRGSLRAALAAGLPCITTSSELTSAELSQVVVLSKGPAQTLECAIQLMTRKDERDRLSYKAREYSKSFTWERIATLHAEMYRELVRLRN